MSTKKIFITLIIMNIFQVLLTLSIVFLMLTREGHFWDILVYFAAFFMIFNVLMTVLAFGFILKAKNMSLIESIRNLEQLNTTLRSQRHDYLNHIQVVYGLLELDEYEEAKTYIQPVFKEINKVSMAMKTAQPAVNALLQAKLQMAEKHKIDMYLEISTDLKSLAMEPWELCKVLSNVIDNAITALEQKEGIREMHIEIGEEEKTYHFNISNNGPQIAKDKMVRIFEEGYSTKKEMGHGMGLSIVKQILQEAGGKINVTSKAEKTCFSITLDKLKF